MKQNNRCAICGKSKVKLWRPYTGSEPLLCSTGVHQRETNKQNKLDQINIILYGEHLTMVPAIFDKDGSLLAYGFEDEKLLKEWENLPE